MSIQVIFFDAAGTLFHVRGSVAEVYLQYGEKYGLKRTPAMISTVNAAFARAFQDAPAPVFHVSDPREIKRSERLWWFDLVHNVFYRVGMFEGFDEYFEEVFQAFDGPAHWVLYPETLAVLKGLRSQGYELGIISNFDSRLFTILPALGLSNFFQTVTLSTLAHAAKPAVQIFRVALEKHAVDPEDAVHVGDSVRDDVEGARAARLHPVLLNRAAGTHPDVRSGSATPMIQSLEALPAVLAALNDSG
jgi:putative hydrolase of the HAD superfamily